MGWAEELATMLAAALPIRVIEQRNCNVRAYAQAMAVCSAGHPCSAVVVRRGAGFEVAHPFGSYPCTTRVDSVYEETTCHTILWPWHVATGVYTAGVDQIIDPGIRPMSPMMPELHWLTSMGLVPSDPHFRRFEVPGSLSLALSDTRGRPTGSLEQWFDKRMPSVSSMPPFSRVDIGYAHMALELDLDHWEASHGNADGSLTTRRELLAQYLTEWTDRLEQRGLLKG